MNYVYTAIFGDIPDQLRTPVADPAATYVAFRDSRSAGGSGATYRGWQLKPPEINHPNPRRAARYHKCRPDQLFDDAEYSLWIDGCLQLLTPIGELIDKYLVACDLAVFKHRQRDCVYQEGKACVDLKKDDPAVIERQLAGYREMGYPDKNGLGETTAVLRRHTPRMRVFNERWEHEIVHNSLRDQLSFDVVCWQLGLPYNHLAGSRVKSPHFAWYPHR